MKVYCQGERSGGVYSPIEFLESEALFSEDGANYQDDLALAVTALKKDLQEQARAINADALVGFFLKTELGTESEILIVARATAVKFA